LATEEGRQAGGRSRRRKIRRAGDRIAQLRLRGREAVDVQLSERDRRRGRSR